MKKKAFDWSPVLFFLVLFGVPLVTLFFFSKEAFAGGVFVTIYICLFMLIDDAHTFSG